MELNGEPPPLWPDLSTSMPRRRSSSSLLLNPPLLIIILPIIALLLLFFAVPSFLWISSQIVRQNTVKKSWDSLIVVLALFAIFCGIFARGNDDGSSADEDNTAVTNDISRDAGDYKPDSVSQQWFGQYSGDDHRINKIYDSPPIRRPVTGTGRLKRNSSSYPDLRQDSLWETGDERFRFFDDFEIHKYRSPPASTNSSDHYVQHRRRPSEIEEPEAKVIPVDTFELRSSPPPPPASPASPPPPPPPPTVVHHKPRRAYQSVRNNKVKGEKKRNRDTEFTKIKTSPPTPPPPPPPPPPPSIQTTYRSEQKNGKSERKKSNATKEIKMVLASLYNQRKRKKKQKTKNGYSYDDHQHHSPVPESPPYYSTIPPPSPPPPPPLPPPPSVFYGLFKKGSKAKKVHSVPAPPPPPPPRPPSSTKKKIQVPKPPPAPSIPPLEPSPRRNSATTSRRPPLPTRVKNNYDENVNSGNQSPLIPMPPPPPPPPFRIAETNFAVRGDFVRIRSSHSSQCSSPELDDVDVLSSKEESETVSVMDGDDGVGSSGGPVFCPSPDVNVKADTFIARLRDGWKLENMNSKREKRKMGHS